MNRWRLAPVLLVLLIATCRNATRERPRASSQRVSTSQAERVDSDHQPTVPRQLHDILRQTKRAFETHQTIAQLGSLLSVKPVALENAGWWRLALPIEETVLTVGTEKDTGLLDEADFAFPVARGLRLVNLTADFGESRTIHEGETSSVLFAATPPENVVVYADLLSTKVAPDALIVGVRLMRKISAPASPAPARPIR